MSAASVVTSHNPAAGRQSVTLTSWAGDAAFSPAPVSGGQIEGDSGLTIGVDGVVTGADGTYTLHHINASGLIDVASYQIGVPPQVATVTTSYVPAAGRQVVDLTSGPGNVAFTPAAGSGDQYEGDAALTIGADAVVLGADGTYIINRIRSNGQIDQTSYTIGVPVPEPQTASVVTSYLPPSGLTLVTFEAPLVHYIDSDPNDPWPSPLDVDDQALFNASEFALDKHGNWSAEAEGVYSYWYINNIGQVFNPTFTAQNLPEVPPEETEAPKGTWTIGAISVGQTTASLTPTYTGNDAASYEYSFNGSAWTTFTGTLSFSGLDPEVSYGGAVRAVNSIGAGSPESFAFKTERVPVPPTVDTPLPDLNLSETAQVSISLDDYFSHATSYTVTGFPAGSGLSLAGRVITGKTNKTDTASSPFALTVTATNADGSASDAFSLTVVDDIAPVLSINSLTTLNAAPIVSGGSDDAVSLALTVNGVTYNPAPNNGAWSQQLPSLPLNTYVMAINGQDAAGNQAVERKAFLHIVSELPVTSGGLFRPLFRKTASPSP